jgi:subtilisin family serine protease
MAVAIALIATVGIPAVSATQPQAPAPGSRFHGSGLKTGAWLVRFRSDVTDTDATRVVKSSGATELGDLDEIKTHVVDVPSGRQARFLQQLAHDPRVLSVEQDGTAQTTIIPRDPHWQQAWGPRVVRAPAAWNFTTGRAMTIIAIVDTGVDRNQPDLRGRVLRGWDFQNDDATPNDDNGHGTAVAGVAAAAANDGTGIAGMCWHCRILPVKVLNANGSGSHSNIAAGIVWAAKHGADVINLSLAGPNPSTAVADAVQYARARGVVVVAAAGNEGTNRRYYPASLPGVISVGATNSSDRLYSWSNRGSWTKVSAPGCAVTGSTHPVRWTWWCGTSFATPMVAGIAALMKSQRPDAKRSLIERILLNSTVHVRGVAYGRVDAYRALRSMAALPDSPTTEPTPTP